MERSVVQKRVVNVYRLITRGTLEEKIMGLQKFKMSIANTVISQDNASLQSMGTDQLLDLFTLDKVRRAAPLAQRRRRAGAVVRYVNGAVVHLRVTRGRRETGHRPPQGRPP